MDTPTDSHVWKESITVKEFKAVCPLTDFVLPANRPDLNGCVERANGASRSEFYNRYMGPLSVSAVNRELAAFQWHYNHYRPYDGIDLETPMAYYQQLMQAA